MKAAEQILRARLNFQGTTMGFSTEKSDALWWLMISADSNANKLLVALNDAPAWKDDMPRRVRTALAISGLPADALELEITESMLMGDDGHALESLAALKQSGIKLAIDDFGTGYSNLAYLKRFDVDRLKIDQSFVRDVDTRPEAEAIVGAVIEMGRRLGLNTLAEGVETEGERAALLHAGCNDVQGYLLGRPMTEEALTQLLGRQPSDAVR
jgi:EAL domain-containing protein (putative c-di-GMP-specific phosphodiesterase class I)